MPRGWLRLTSALAWTALALASAHCESPAEGSDAGASDMDASTAGRDASSRVDAAGIDAARFDAARSDASQLDAALPPAGECPPDAGFDHVLELDGPYTTAEFDALFGALGPGTVLVRPAAGASATVDFGDNIFEKHPLPRSGITLCGIHLTGAMEIVSDTTLWSVRGDPFVFSSGGDDVVIRDSYFSGGAGTALEDGCTGNLYHQNTLGGADNWLVENNTFENYTNREELCADDHSEALYLGERTTNWTIRGNTFNNNGSTAHIFFTWWYCDGSYRPDCDPVNVCVEENTFMNVVNRFGTAIQARMEFPDAATVYIDPAQDVGGFPDAWRRPCP
ncbi:MAG: right-handed parallel beta-helix repeat-containing protein [Sandaracinaceae bacterium]